MFDTISSFRVMTSPSIYQKLLNENIRLTNVTCSTFAGHHPELPRVIEAREPTLFQSSFKASHQGQALNVSWKGVLPQQQLFGGFPLADALGVVT